MFSLPFLFAIAVSHARLTVHSRDISIPFYHGLGTHHRAISTKSRVAQKYFDQGMAFLFGFNHDEAIKAFRAATKADPDCAMAYWAIANAYGPNINYPMVDPIHAAGAWEALQKAEALASKAKPVEQALIAAQAQRYANPQPEDRSKLDKAYSDAIKVYQQDLRDHPNNGWALKGLALAYAGLGDTKTANSYRAIFALAWKDADLKINLSCLCVKGPR